MPQTLFGQELGEPRPLSQTRLQLFDQESAEQQHTLALLPLQGDDIFETSWPRLVIVPAVQSVEVVGVVVLITG